MVTLLPRELEDDFSFNIHIKRNLINKYTYLEGMCMTTYAYTILLNQISTLVHAFIMLKNRIPWYVFFGNVITNNHVL
jgi:hypothetical protein